MVKDRIFYEVLGTAEGRSGTPGTGGDTGIEVREEVRQTLEVGGTGTKVKECEVQGRWGPGNVDDEKDEPCEKEDTSSSKD